jgi:hypothetical protein
MASALCSSRNDVLTHRDTGHSIRVTQFPATCRIRTRDGFEEKQTMDAQFPGYQLSPDALHRIRLLIAGFGATGGLLGITAEAASVAASAVANRAATAGSFVYDGNVNSLLNKKPVKDIAGNYEGECVSLVKRYIPALQNRSTRDWKEGANVIEALKKGVTIAKGTAIATFVNGKFISGHGHAAFYNGYFYDNTGDLRISVIEQYNGTRPSDGVQERPLPNEGKDANGDWINRSNNGRAFSIILLP